MHKGCTFLSRKEGRDERRKIELKGEEKEWKEGSEEHLEERKEGRKHNSKKAKCASIEENDDVLQEKNRQNRRKREREKTSVDLLIGASNETRERCIIFWGIPLAASMQSAGTCSLLMEDESAAAEVKGSRDEQPSCGEERPRLHSSTRPVILFTLISPNGRWYEEVRTGLSRRSQTKQEEEKTVRSILLFFSTSLKALWMCCHLKSL